MASCFLGESCVYWKEKKKIRDHSVWNGLSERQRKHLAPQSLSLLETEEAMRGPLPVAIFVETKGHVSQLTHQKGTNTLFLSGSEPWT